MTQPVVVVMGVSGSGKSTVAARLATLMDVPLAEGDDFHPQANIGKMAAGHPLTDEDRWPWLRAIAGWIAGRAADGGGVVACSALKRSYRDLLRSADDRVFFVHLAGTPELLAARLGARTGHFMPAGLLDSQLADLQPLQPDERGVELDVAQPPDELAREAWDAIRSARP